jgi:hypothetical protein
VLDRAQEVVGVRQLAPRALADEAAVGQPPQRDERVRRLQPRVAPAVRELERLRDELYLAYAAAAELDVEAARLLRVEAVDLLLGEPHVGERLRDRLLGAVDARAKALGETREERLRAGRRARADEHLPLPRVRRRAVVAQRLGERDGERPVAAVRPQTQINAVGRALARRVAADDARDALGQAAEELAVRRLAALARARGLAVVRVEEEEVYVRGVVQLARAELAERDDRHLGHRLPPALVRALRRAVEVLKLLPRERERVDERGVGEVGKLLGRLDERGGAAYVAEVDAQKLPPAEARELHVRRDLRVREREACERLAQLFGRPHARVRALAREPAEVLGILFERRRQQRAPRSERQRVGQKPLVAPEGARGAGVRRRDALVEVARALGVGQLAYE